jgi:hypothetical protein
MTQRSSKFLQHIAKEVFLYAGFSIIVLVACGCKSGNHTDQQKHQTVDTLHKIDSAEFRRVSAKDSLSLMESRISQPGSLVITDKFSVGELRFRKTGRKAWDNAESLFQLEAMVVRDANNKALKLRALRVGVGTDFDERNRFKTTVNRHCLVYITEISSVLSNIDSMAVLHDKWASEQKEESKANFVTEGGFEITLLKRANEEFLLVGCGGTKFVETCSIQTTKDLMEIKALFIEGETRLKSM